MAISGSSAGAKVIHHECGSPLPDSAVPVFPATFMPSYLGLGKPPLDDDLLHHPVQRGGRTRWDRLPADARGGLVEDYAVGGADLAHEAGLHEPAVVGDGGCDERHLEGVGLNLALAEGRLGEGARGPLSGGRLLTLLPETGRGKSS